MIDSLALLIAGVEWVVIILLALILLLGTKKLPELGRSLGRAVGEYQRARRSLERELSGVDNSISIPIRGPLGSERVKLEIIARSLQIDPSGKSDDELREIIYSRLK